MAVVVFSLSCGFASGADWRADLLSYLGPRPDFAAARAYLDSQWTSLEDADRQTALALLAFLARKTLDVDRERSLVVDYFEMYHDTHPDFGFLDDWTRRDFLSFWGFWTTNFPLVTGLSFLDSREVADTGLPATIEVGLNLLNDAYYRISLESRVLEGGHWSGGFHILTIPVSRLFEKPGSYEFVLDLKRNDLIVRKPFRIDIDVKTRGSERTDAGTKDLIAGPSPASPTKIPEGEIALYVDGKLILTSKKSAPRSQAPLKIPIPGPSMPGQKPYLVPPRDDPMSRGVSILDALSLAYKAIKDLTKKKPPKASPPSYAKVDTLTFSFLKWDSEGMTAEAQAMVRMRPLKAVLLTP